MLPQLFATDTLPPFVPHSTKHIISLASGAQVRSLKRSPQVGSSGGGKCGALQKTQNKCEVQHPLATQCQPRNWRQGSPLLPARLIVSPWEAFTSLALVFQLHIRSDYQCNVTGRSENCSSLWSFLEAWSRGPERITQSKTGKELGYNSSLLPFRRKKLYIFKK